MITVNKLNVRKQDKTILTVDSLHLPARGSIALTAPVNPL